MYKLRDLLELKWGSPTNQLQYSIIIFTIFYKFRYNLIGEKGAAALGESIAKLQNLTNLNLVLW